MNQIQGVKCKSVSYKRIKEIEKNPPLISEMPFVKRHPYQDEKEFRIIYENHAVEEKYKQIPIDLSSIDRITLSPWTPEPLIKPVREAIKKIHNIRVLKTTLLSNNQWKQIGDNIKNV